MIFYFSGTGNSLYVAKEIAKQQNDSLVSIAECMQQQQFEFTLKENESIGFSFPVYFWGMPTIVEDFIQKLSLRNYNGNYIYAVFNCGGSIGSTDSVFKKRLKIKRYYLTTSFSVFMPDNYILLMDLLTPPHEVSALLQKTDVDLVSINSIITKKEVSILPLHKKRWAWLESALTHPYYKHFRSTKPFHTTSDCTSCGLCQEVCPCQTITLQEGKPIWGKECTQCLACLHRCPVKAVQYGKKTYTRGRYLHPEL